VINMMPAFMPSSWMVMAFFYIQFDLPLLPLTLGGAFVSGLGRIVLAKSNTIFKRRFMRGQEEDLDELGTYLNERGRQVSVFVFLYSLTPLPTNNLWVAAGLAEVNLVYVLAGFWTARAVADTFFVWTTDRVFNSLEDVFTGAWGSWPAIALQLLSVTSILLLYKVPWAQWLRRWMRRRAGPQTAQMTQRGKGSG
jgi:hypothetical protein